MEVMDVVKIVIPIIVTLCGALFLMVRWTIDRQSRSSNALLKVFEESLLRTINQVSMDYENLRKTTNEFRNHHDARIHKVEQNLGEFKKEVAEFYIKRQDWLEHAVSLERKVDELRNDMHKELQEINRLLIQRMSEGAS